MVRKPILIYDGDCAFCSRWIARWKKLTSERVEYRPFQEVATDFPQIPTPDFNNAVHWVGPTGEVSVAAEAIFRTLEGTSWGWLLACYRKFPGFGPLAEFLYRQVAKNRQFFSRFS